MGALADGDRRGARSGTVFVGLELARAQFVRGGSVGHGTGRGEAVSALPALEQALKMHRVSYAAQEAIHKIKGEPVPVWY